MSERFPELYKELTAHMNQLRERHFPVSYVKEQVQAYLWNKHPDMQVNFVVDGVDGGGYRLRISYLGYGLDKDPPPVSIDWAKLTVQDYMDLIDQASWQIGT